MSAWQSLIHSIAKSLIESFPDRCRFLALASAEVIQLRAAGAAFLFHFYFRDARGMERKHALDTLPIRNAPDREGFVQPAAFAANDDAGKNLDSFLIAFHDPCMDPNSIADFEIRYVGLELFLFDCVDDAVHNGCPPGPLAGGHFQAEEGKMQMAIPFLLLIMILLLIFPAKGWDHEQDHEQEQETHADQL
jgi:hypothetical protein